jgi:thioredoxin reductase (NADPH)
MTILPATLAGTVADPKRAFPTLTAQQMARLSGRGQRRQTIAGEVLYDSGDKGVPMFAVVSGELEVLRTAAGVETPIARHPAGQFSGESTVLSGRRAISRVRVAEAGEVIQIDRDRLLALIQTDAELSEILIGAFLQRRLGMIAADMGDVVVIGSTHDAGTLHVKEFLARNRHPFQYVDLDRDREAQELLKQFPAGGNDVPIVICRGQALHRPTNAQIAECLGFNEELDDAHVADLVIVGAGPSGLAAAVYGASEGLDVLLLESNLPGGQAGSSSRIENYLGFPNGVSGLELTGRAYSQAVKFGARIVVAKRVTRLACDGQLHTLDLEEGQHVRARTVIIATGAEYRKPPLETLSAFEGVGVYYAATTMEAQLCADQDVVVVGGGNAAGQAAVFLASTARRVHVLVRGSDLRDTMSQYLIRRIEEHPAIVVRTHTQIVEVQGNGRLERVRWRDDQTGDVHTHATGQVFIMTGAVPNTKWLDGCIALDDEGFVKTGADLSSDELAARRWPLARPPHLLETSRPGVFAVGDVRSHSVKRVAAAVGEGSMAVVFVHQLLRQ